MNDEIVLSVGDVAPEFCLSNQDDNYVCLEHYRNKWKILYFYDSDKNEDSILEAMDFTAMSEHLEFQLDAGVHDGLWH